MRHPMLVVIAAAAGLGACAPVPTGPYGYAPPGPSSYGYYDGGYAPGPYYEPGYAPYATPGTAIIVGGERRWDDRDRGRYDRGRNEGAFRSNPPPQNRDFGRAQPQQQFRPGPAPVAAARPGPAAQPPPGAPPAGGAAFEQWNRTHVNASPSPSDNGPR